MERKNLNYEVANADDELPKIIVKDIVSLRGKKVVDASITLEPTTFISDKDEEFIVNFVNEEGEIIWGNVDTVTITSEKNVFILNISDELQYAIDNELESVILQFTSTNSSISLELQKVTNKDYNDTVFMDINEFMKNSAKHSVNLNSAGDLSINLSTGTLSLSRTIAPLRTNALMLNLNHIYTSYFDKVKESYGLYSNCGTNWKLGIEQYLIKEIHPLGAELIYLNEYGQEERLVEEYYYIDNNKAKVYVKKDEIEYDVSGALKYDGKDVYTECKTATGLKLVTDKRDIKGAEFVDLEPEELAQIRAQSESIESAIGQLKNTISQSEQQICNLVLTKNKLEDLSTNNGVAQTPASFSEIEFINALHQTFEDIKKVCPAFTESVNKKLQNLFDDLDTEGVVKIPIYDIGQQTTYTMQINTYTENVINYYNQLQTYEIEHLKISYQLKIYEEQTPQYYLYSDSIIYGFSKLEVKDKTEKENPDEGVIETTEEETETEIDRYTLTYISDYYGNTFILKYDTGTNTGYEETEDEKELGKGTYNLLYIVDQNENVITFNYKDELLNSIVDNKENEYKFEYVNGYFNTFSINQNITAKYIYNTDNKLVGVLDKNGMGCLLNYSSGKVETIKPLSTLEYIQGQQHEFKTELNLINSSNIESCVLNENDFVKINYYDYKSTSIISVKKVEDVDKIQKTITYIFDQYGNTQTTYLNDFDENNPDNNRAYVQNFNYISDKITFSSKPYPMAENFLSEVCFSDTPTYQAENFLGDDLIAGDYILCASTPVHTAYHSLTTSVNAKDSIEVPNTLVLNKISQKISCLTLSGWAKANSGFVINEDYEDKEYSDYVKNRKFEIGAIVTYSDNTSKPYKKSFDYMNTGWQFVAVPILLDTSKEITKIECYIDYSNNNGNMQYSDLTLCESQYTINEYNGDLLDKSYSSDSKLGKKHIYNEDEQLIKVYYVEKNLLIPEDTSDVKSNTYDTYEYNINGQLYKTTDYNGIVTEKVFDSNGIETKSLTYHKDNPAEIFYSEQKVDEHGNVVADYNELGDEVNNYTYDGKSGNVVNSKDKNNIETSYGYSKDGDTLLQTATNINGLNNSTTYGYTLDFLTKLSHNDFDITYDYDSQGRTTKISVGGSEYATMEYDDKITKTKFKQDGEDKTIETTLDNEGNVYSIKHNNKTIITNTYNTHNQLLGYVDGLIGENVEYKYDEKGSVKEIIKDNGSFNIDITTSKENDLITNTNVKIVEQQENGNNTLADLTYTYNYDESIDNNLTRVTLPNGTIQNIRLDKLGRTKEIINGDFTKQYSYLTKGNHTSNLVSAEWFGKNNVIRENLHYTYDEKGNITEIKENGKLIARYSYDALSRLVREDNAILNKTITISYDEGGNILNKSEYNYTLKAIDELEAQSSFNYDYRSNGWKDQLMSYNGETFEYDELGNPKTYRNHNLGWNYGRRLMSYDNINYTYDANGIRHTKTVNGITTHFFTNGTQILGQFDGNLLLFYYGVDGINGFRYSYKNENEVWVHQEYAYKKNILGDVIGIYDENRTQICKYVYDAWGKCRTYVLKDNNFVDISDKVCYTDGSNIYEMMAILNPFRYRGYYFDIETGLYYLNSRYYDPETGRFINADDVSILNTSKDEINGINLYVYCFNNPINDIDENGCWSLKKALKKSWKKIAGWAVAVAITALAVTAVVGSVFTGGLLSAVLLGAGIGALTSMGTSIYIQGGFSTADPWNVVNAGFIGTIIGAVSGVVSYGFGLVGEQIGKYFGMSLANATHISSGIKFGQVFGVSFLMNVGSVVGNIVGAFIGGTWINYIINYIQGNEMGVEDTMEQGIQGEIPGWIINSFKWLFT